MRMVWILVRVVLVVLALMTTFFTAVFATGPSGTTVLVDGVVIVAVALVVLIACAVSLWRDLRGGRSP